MLIFYVTFYVQPVKEQIAASTGQRKSVPRELSPSRGEWKHWPNTSAETAAPASEAPATWRLYGAALLEDWH